MRQKSITIATSFRAAMTLFFSIMLISVTSCSTTNSNHLSAPLSVGAEASPFKVSFDAGGKISGKVSATVLFGLTIDGPSSFSDAIAYNGHTNNSYQFDNYFSILSPLNRLKAAAIYHAVTRNDADVIIAPTYIIKDQNYIFIRKVEVSVSGYKGTIKKVTTSW